jgi:vitamin B12 transporter
MHAILLLAVAATPSVPGPVEDPDQDIVVTAAREPVAAQESVVPVIAVREEVGRGLAIDLPTVADAIRGTPGVSVSVSGPRGSQTQVRIRGAEANHTLLFVDGIRFNDPAAGNEARFELLGFDGFARVDIVRGPQSALWGSEAIGGVVAAYTRSAPVGGITLEGLAEHGSLDSSRVSAQALTTVGDVELVATAGWLRSDGIDSFSGQGDRDGFDNRFASFKTVMRPAGGIELGAVGHWVEGESEFDGVDPVTFRRADTADSTRNRIGAVRAWAEIEQGGWIAKLDTSLLASANRNLLAGDPLNRTSGRRFTIGAQLSRQIEDHLVTFAAEHQSEHFRARDQIFFGATDQDQSRDLDAAVLEWRADWFAWLTTDLALRHDSFSAFRDATTIRAGATVKPVRRLNVILGYGEGIAQPTFFDLFGFFPGSFTGNPALGPERSEEWHAGIRWGEGGPLRLGLSAFTARLRDEIVDVFDPATFRSTTANATGTSRRRGIEAEAELRLSRAARFSFYYTWLDAEERLAAGALAVREIRRPRHSFMLSGFGETGRLTWGVSLAYVGKRRDSDFDSFPIRTVVLDDYVLASARLAWRISPALEAYVRAENALDAGYQDVFGYRTPGRTAYAGLRLRFRD